MTVQWVAVDWGSSNLRIWGMDDRQECVFQVETDEGAGGLSKDGFEPILLSHIGDFIKETPLPVIACGMVGSKQGWQEANYLSTPCVPGCQYTKLESKTIDLRILPGIQQVNPPDVMRGEETQIAGLLQHKPNFSGVVCLPGTHSKWVKVSNGKVHSFTTVMTGELFTLLSQKSVLRHSILDNWNEEAFVKSVKESFNSPEKAVSSLFGIRASHIIHQETNGKAYLSGLLLGLELAGVKDFWHNQSVEVIGNIELGKVYKTALETVSSHTHPCHIHDKNLTLDGLKRAYKEIYHDNES